VTVIMAAVFVYLTLGTYKSFCYEQKRMQAFYITNAGINQAIWYLSTPASMGGHGPTWRVKDLKKYFSTGLYTISIEDGKGPGEIVITSKGKAEDITLVLKIEAIYARSLPAAFSFALFSNSELSLGGASVINGSLYVNDNLNLRDTTAVTNGKVILSPGYSLEEIGSPRFAKAAASKPYPSFPVIDTSFYYEKISHAKGRTPDVIQGDVEYKDVDLNGRSIYVNGNVTIKGSIKGRGSIVSTRNMTLIGNGSINDGALLICNGKLKLSGKHNVNANPCIYSKQMLSVDAGTVIKGGCVILSPTVVDIGPKCSVAGLIYGPTVNIDTGAKIEGSVAAENFGAEGGILKDISVTYNPSQLPLTVLGFNVGSEMVMRKPGSLKEI